MEHKPNCSINIQCAVYHANGICNHEKYGKCDCAADNVSTHTTPPDWEIEFDEKFITDDGDYSYVANDIEASTVKSFIRKEIASAYDRGWKEGRVQLCIEKLEKEV